jgi:hypothetical protein
VDANTMLPGVESSILDGLWVLITTISPSTAGQCKLTRGSETRGWHRAHRRQILQRALQIHSGSYP